MKKREVFLVILVIAFGIFYNLYEEGEMDVVFFDGCSITPGILQDSRHAVSFPRPAVEFSGLQSVEIANPAGEVSVLPAADSTFRLEPVVVVYHKDKKETEQVNSQIKVQTNVTNGTLKIVVDPEKRFPYRRVRVSLKLFLPGDTALNVHNQYGRIDIENTNSNITLDERHGDIRVKNAGGSLDIRSRFGKVETSGTGGDINLDVEHGRIHINDAMNLSIRCVHSRVVIADIGNETNFSYAGYCNIEVSNSRDLEIDAVQSGIKVNNIKNRVIIENTHGNIILSDIGSASAELSPALDSAGSGTQGVEENTALVKLTGRNCRIKMTQVRSSADIVVKSRYGSVNMQEITAKNIDLSVAIANLDLQFIRVEGRINITNRHSRVNLAYPPDVAPSFNIAAEYGQIYNRTSTSFAIIKQEHKSLMTQPEGKPEIIINNTYGDITLNHFRPVSVPTTSPIPGTGKEKIDVELQNFTQPVKKIDEIENNVE